MRVCACGSLRRESVCVCERERERENVRVLERMRRGDRSGTKYGTFAIEYVYDCSMRTESS